MTTYLMQDSAAPAKKKEPIEPQADSSVGAGGGGGIDAMEALVPISIIFSIPLAFLMMLLCQIPAILVAIIGALFVFVAAVDDDSVGGNILYLLLVVLTLAGAVYFTACMFAGPGGVLI